MNLDIQTGVKTVFFILIAGGLLSFIIGIRTIRSAHRLLYYRKRRERTGQGWKMVLAALLMAGLAFVTNRYAEPVAYRVFPPTPTITMTPTITLTPTITETPTITLTPTLTETPLFSATPYLPDGIATLVESTTTPSPEFVFSVVTLAKDIDDDYQPIDPQTEFDNPVGKLYGTYSFDKMTANAQLSILWVRMSDQAIICYTSAPWDGSTGGYAYTECEPSSEQWKPGEYQVQIYVGREWANSGAFSVLGEAPTPTATVSPTYTITPSATITLSPTITTTPRDTATRTPTITFTASRTLPPSITPTVTRTPTITPTPTITRTPRPTDTRWPSPTP
jgi:type VI secretion system secreted protein VgrG